MRFDDIIEVAWWAPGTEWGHNWLITSWFEFRIGVPLDIPVIPPALLHDIDYLKDTFTRREAVHYTTLMRIFHRFLIHGGAVETRYTGGWRLMAALWYFHFVAHFKLNPRGNGCVCWRND